MRYALVFLAPLMAFGADPNPSQTQASYCETALSSLVEQVSIRAGEPVGRALLEDRFGWTLKPVKFDSKSYTVQEDDSLNLDDVFSTVRSLQDLGYAIPKGVVFSYGSDPLLNFQPGVQGLRHLGVGNNILDKNLHELNLLTMGHELSHLVMAQEIVRTSPETDLAKYHLWKDRHTSEFKRLEKRVEAGEITGSEAIHWLSEQVPMPPGAQKAMEAFLPFDELNADLAGVLIAERILPGARNLQEVFDQLDPERKFTPDAQGLEKKQVTAYTYFSSIRPAVYKMAKEYGPAKVTQALREIGMEYTQNPSQRIRTIKGNQDQYESENQVAINKEVLAKLSERFPLDR